MDSFEGITEFVAVAEMQSFTGAAKHLGCSTSHVSRQLARLEGRLGSALVARTTRMISLTKSGALYYQQCKELVIGLQQANEQVSSLQYQLNGTLRVSAAGTFAESYVVPALIEFAQGHPELTVDVDFNSRIINFVEDGFDFVIRYGRLSESGLIARKLVDRSMMAAASPDYLAEHGTPQEPEQLKKHSCIIANSDYWGFEHKGVHRNVKVAGRFHCNNGHAVIKACESGLGVAYLPRSNFVGRIGSGGLEPILEPYWDSSISSWIVYQNRQFLPSRARLAIDFLLDHFADWKE